MTTDELFAQGMAERAAQRLRDSDAAHAKMIEAQDQYRIKCNAELDVIKQRFLELSGVDVDLDGWMPVIDVEINDKRRNGPRCWYRKDDLTLMLVENRLGVLVRWRCTHCHSSLAKHLFDPVTVIAMLGEIAELHTQHTCSGKQVASLLTDPSTIIDAAATAKAERDQKHAEEREQSALRTRREVDTRLRKALNAIGTDVPIVEGTATVGDLTFVVMANDLRITRQCSCGSQVWSPAIRSLADVGSYLAGELKDGHVCSMPPNEEAPSDTTTHRELSAAEMFMDAFQRMQDEMVLRLMEEGGLGG